MTGVENIDSLHFWEQGPQDVERLARPIYANKRRHDWRFRFYVERIEGTTLSRGEALRRLGGTIHHAQGWERTGVRWARTMNPALANIRLAVVPAGDTGCGPGAAGCYSWGSGTPLAEIEAPMLEEPAELATVLGMELCGHGTFRALDMYDIPHSPPYDPYHGSMGTWREAAKTQGYPTDAEIAACKRWLAGEVPAELVHDH